MEEARNEIMKLPAATPDDAKEPTLIPKAKVVKEKKEKPEKKEKAEKPEKKEKKVKKEGEEAPKKR